MPTATPSPTSTFDPDQLIEDPGRIDTVDPDQLNNMVVVSDTGWFLFTYTGIGIIVFAVALIVFLLVMKFARRTLWSGICALGLMCATGIALLAPLVDQSLMQADYLPQWLAVALFALLTAVLVAIVFFPIALAVFLIWEGVRLLRREGFSFANCLSLGLGLGIVVDLLLIPAIRDFAHNAVANWAYAVLSVAVTFFSALLAIYVLSALLNLSHARRPRHLGQIVVLGSGLFGTTVPPLLQSRIRRGIDLQRDNPDATLILSGGQGPGEDMPEGEAMRDWALANGADPARTIAETRSVNTYENLEFSRALFPHPNERTAIVSTSYHVFRALLISRKLHIDAIGYGSKTKWYFALNALLREYVAYIAMTRKRQLILLGVFLLPIVAYGALDLAHYVVHRIDGLDVPSDFAPQD